MADNVEIQGLEFQIMGETEQAEKGLKSFVSTLNKLKKIGEKGLGLSSVIQELREVNGAVGELDTTNVTTLANALQTISSSSRRLTTVRGHLQAMSELDFSNLTEAADAISRMGIGGRGNGANVGGNLPADAPMPSADEATTERVEGTAQAARRAGQAFQEADNSAANFFKNIKAKSVLGMSQVKLLKAEIAAMKRELQDGIASGKWDDKRIASTALSIQKLKAQLKGITPLWRKIAGSGLKGLGNVVATPFQRLGDTVKSAYKSVKGFMSSLGRIAMYRAIRAAIAALTQGLKEGIGYLNLYSKSAGTQFHKSLNSLATDALYLKASLAAAVAPIVDALAPALDYLADKIATVLNLLAQLFAKLSGKSVYTKAVKTQTEYSDSISKAASKTKDFLADFDELNVFDPNKGGGGGSDLPDWKNMFEEAEVDEDLGNFADRVRDAFKNGEWDELGKIVAQKVNETLDGIDWSGIGSKIGRGINGAIKTAYSFLSNTDFNRFGSHVADLLNHALAEIDFNTAGRLMVRWFTAGLDFLIGFLGELDWGLVGKSIGDFFRGAFDEASEWIAKYDWKAGTKKAWKKLKQFIEGLDIAEITKSIGRFVKNVIKATADIISSLDWADVVYTAVHFLAEAIRGVEVGELLKALAYLAVTIVVNIPSIVIGALEGVAELIGDFFEEIGLDSVAGFFFGIRDALKNVGKWLKENFVDPVVNKVKDWLGINSPSTVFAEIGRYIVEGLYEGIKNKITTGISIIRGWAESVYNWFTGGDGNGTIFEKFRNAATTIVSSFREKVSSTYTTVKSSVTTWASSVRDWFTNSSFGGVNATNFATFASNVINGFKDRVSSTYSTVKTSITTWASSVRDWFTNSSFGGVNATNFGAFATTVINSFKDKVSSTYTTVKTSITTWATSVKDWFTNSSFGGVNLTTFTGYAESVINGFKNKVSSTYTTVKTSITTWASSVKDWFTGSSHGGVNSTNFATYASNIINGFKDKISSTYTNARTAVTSWASSVKTWFTDTVSSSAFGTIASNIITGFKNGISNNYSTVKSTIESWASNVKSWFTNTVSYSSFYSIASDVISGFKNGIGNLYSSMKSTIDSWGSSIISWFKSKLNSNSPSKVFEQIGKDTVLGYNIGLENFGKSTKGVVNSWADSFTSVTPTMKFAVDTSALRYYDSSSFARNVATDINAKTDFSEVGFAEAMAAFYHEYLEPTLLPMADDMRRQADKKEQTVVNVGNRTIKEAVMTQERADGYRFVRA